MDNLYSVNHRKDFKLDKIIKKILFLILRKEKLSLSNIDILNFNFLTESMNPLFNLKQTAAELPSINDGMANLTYDQHSPSRDVTGSNFPNGTIHIKWENSGGTWWVPSKSYIRMRAKITHADGTPVLIGDDAAPNMGLMSNLFQSCEFKIADKTVSRVSDYMAQVDALQTRLTKSKSYLDSVGASLNFWQHEYTKRSAIVAADGDPLRQMIAANGLTQVQMGFTLGALLTVDLVGGGKSGTATWSAGPNGDIRTTLKVGDVIQSSIGQKMTITGFTAPLVATVVSESIIIAVAGVSGNFIFPVALEEYCARRNEFECIWKPPLSIFNVGHAMPTGKYEIQLNPHNSTVFQKMAIESIGSDRAFGASAGNFNFEVIDFYLYLATIQGPVVENIQYFLSLEETRCQTDNVDNNNGLQQKNFDISPASFALTLAFQDVEAGTDTRLSSSKFKIRQIDGTVDLPNLPADFPSGELALRRMYLQYAGITKPSPDADPEYASNATGRKDFLSSRYAESMLYSGAYFDTGGAEDKNDWIQRGPYYYFSWPKDGVSESTRVNVNYSFQAALGEGRGRVLLFDHYKQMVMVSVVGGMVVDVVSRDA